MAKKRDEGVTHQRKRVDVMMLTELCHEVHNWFETNVDIGEFVISGGSITRKDGSLPGLKNEQYYRIIGSTYNDGVYLFPEDELKDEEFEGAVWSMSVPQEFLLLASDIERWKEKYQSLSSPAMSPFSSESFGGYSYSKESAGAVSWKNVFSHQLNRWRKLR